MALLHCECSYGTLGMCASMEDPRCARMTEEAEDPPASTVVLLFRAWNCKDYFRHSEGA